MARPLPHGLSTLAHRLGLPDRFLRFAAVGLVGVGVNLGLLYLLTTLAHWFYLLSAGFAIEASIWGNFLLNYLWTWGDRAAPPLRSALLFHSVSLVGLGLNLAILAALVQGLGLHYLPSDMLGIAAATLWNFYANDLWTFRPRAGAGARGESP
jgi:dolichol-phosphate mannosyltransferase